VNAARKLKRRVRAGLASQDVVSFYIKSYAADLGFRYRVARKAGFGQQTSDLSFVIEGNTVNVEVKGAANRAARIAVFDKSVRRKSVPAEIERVASAFIQTLKFQGRSLKTQMEKAGYSLDFLGMLDFYRDKQDPAIGLAEDSNTASSGKLPREFSSTDALVCRAARLVILETFKSAGDSYFAVHDKSTDDVDAWHTGLGRDLLEFGPFPRIKSVTLDTYGGASGPARSTRIGLKITL
jgi:hypothetical protein